MSVGVSIEREQNDVSKTFCGNYPYFGTSHQRYVESKQSTFAGYQSFDPISDSVGYVDYKDSHGHVHPEGASQDFSGQQSSKTSQSGAQNPYESDYGTWYVDDTNVVNHTGYETQGYTEYGNMMPPYYASERKYIELWVQCPRQPGIDSCEHSNQSVCYSECYEPATNSKESLNWENNEWVYEDGSFQITDAQACCQGSSEDHGKQQFAEFHSDSCGVSNSKTCKCLSFNDAEIQTTTEKNMYRVTSDTKYEEVEAKILHSEFNERRDHEQVTKHVTKSVSFSSGSIKIEVLNRKSSFDCLQIPESLESEKARGVKSKRRSRHKRKSKVPIDQTSVLNPIDSPSTEANNEVNTKHEVTLRPYEHPLSDCDRFERYLNRELTEHDNYNTYARAGQPTGKDATRPKETAEIPVKTKSQEEKGPHQIRQRTSTPTTRKRRVKAVSDIKPSMTSTARTLKATNKIDTLCKAVTKYLPEMRQEQKLIAGQLILTVLGEGVKNLLSKSTVLATKNYQIPHRSASVKSDSKDQTTQCPETQLRTNPVNTACDEEDVMRSSAKPKRTRRKPRWKKKKKTGLDQELQTVPGVTMSHQQ